jgi:hypothetical protein
MDNRFIIAFVLAHACSLAPLAAQETPQAGPGGIAINRMIQSESKQRMNMNEPMSTGMARKGQKKGDVKADAMKKEVYMDEMMKQEEMKQ